MKLHIVRLLTWTWFCLLAIIPVVYMELYIYHLQSSGFFMGGMIVGLIGGVLVSYLPLVFLAVFPSVVLESLIINPDHPGLLLSKDSWYGAKGIIGFDSECKTLCSHCWATPLKFWFLFASIVLFIPIIIPFIVSALLLRSFCFTFFVLVSMIFFKIDWRKVRKTYISLTDFQEVILYRKMKVYRPNIFKKFFGKIWENISIVKNKACPRILWKE